MDFYSIAFIGFVVFGIITLVMTKKRRQKPKRIFMTLTLICWCITLVYMLNGAMKSVN